MFKTIKAKVIFVIIFCIICISTTLGLILYKNIEIDQDFIKDSNIANVEETKGKEEKGIDLKGTYNQNDLTIQEKKATKENIEINYCQIYGLKNKIIQDKINKELETVALNFYREKVKDLNEVISVSVDMINIGNFANTLSFEVAYVAKIDDDADGFYQDSKGLNYDLVTGEEITIDKLFTINAPIKDILRKSAYYNLIQNNLEDNLAGNFVVADYGEIEDDIEMFINDYEKGKIKNFNFSPKCIYIYHGKDNIITIDMKKYADYICIYNRYLTEESIFETNNIGLKNLYTLSERGTFEYRYTNYEKVKEIEKEIEKTKIIANKDANKFYILNYYIDVYTKEEDSIQQTLTYCRTRGNSYEMTAHDFEESVEPAIIEFNRAGIGGDLVDYVYNFEEILKVKPQETIEYYNPETGDKIVI